MKRDQALQILAAHKDEFAQRGVKSIAIFGSTARDEAGPSSDVDILVEIDSKGKPFGLFAFIGLAHFLEDLLGQKVDLVERDAIRPELKDRILGEAIRAA